MLDNVNEIDYKGSMMNEREIKKALRKIRAAKDFNKKNAIFLSMTFSEREREQIVLEMVKTLPAGYYKLHGREYGTNLIDTAWTIYGPYLSIQITERIMLGLQTLYPKKFIVSFTLGLDAIQITNARIVGTGA